MVFPLKPPFSMVKIFPQPLLPHQASAAAAAAVAAAAQTGPAALSDAADATVEGAAASITPETWGKMKGCIPDLSGWWFGTCFFHHIQLGISSSQLTNMYLFTNMCPKNHPNVGKYTIHGAYGPYLSGWWFGT